MRRLLCLDVGLSVCASPPSPTPNFRLINNFHPNRRGGGNSFARRALSSRQVTGFPKAASASRGLAS